MTIDRPTELCITCDRRPRVDLRYCAKCQADYDRDIDYDPLADYWDPLAD